MEDFECSVCEETFENRSALDTHMKQAHGSAVVQNYKCAICGGTFNSEGELSAHIKDDHPSDVPAK
jgi:hypothetical protein